MKNLFDLTGKVIIVTGGSGFLGSQFVAHLRECGATVVIFDTNAPEPVDITNPASVEAATQKVVAVHGRIDGVVHAAGMAAEIGKADELFAPYEKFSIELWRKEFEINLTAAQIVTQAVVPQMMKQKSGSVVFIASDLSLIAPNNSIYDGGKFKDIAYVSSKAGMLGLMRGWASYLGAHNIRSNALVPGGMYKETYADEFVKKNSAQNMLGRMSLQGEYNAPLQFLLSDASSYMTGQSLIVDGGRTAW
jgi:NAD(P)-dependent dehydrogenase (short-subunit alcohol dehydrogenase family)